MLAVVAFVIVAALAIVVGIAATRPAAFRVERSLSIAAPPERVYAAIEDFGRWSEWSPFDKLDPAMTRTIGGAPRGRGATYAWSGNAKAGAGRMEIVDATAPSHVAIRLDFSKPFEAHNHVDFTLRPEGDATRVTWAMHGASPFVAKLFGVFVDMDRMIGKDFEAGLASLKARVERPGG